jgi:pimeloyl-ACP methyl ester carboxylesterase
LPSKPGRRDFFAAYDAMLREWPAGVGAVDIPTPNGLTRVQTLGKDSAPPLLLLHGGGATSTVWHSVAGSLARTRRVYAVDQIGDAGRSVVQRAPGDRAQLMS